MSVAPRVSAREAYLATRVDLMADRLVPPARLRRLVDAEVGELAAILREFGIEADDPLQLVRTGKLFQVLLRHLLTDFVVLLRPLCPGGKQLFRYWLRRYDLRNVKTLIRGRMSRQAVAEIRANLLDLSPFEQIDTESLLTAEDISELLRLLERSPLAMIARQARRVADREHEPYRLDAGLDRHYWGGLGTHIDATRPEDRPALRALIGDLIDATNLVWLLRFRFNYKLPAAETYYLLIGGGRQLRRTDLLRLVELPDLHAVIDALPPKFRDGLADADTTLAVERRLERRIAAMLRATYADSHSFVARTLAFLMLRESDMHRLRSVMRGKVLGLSPELIRESIDLTPHTD